MGCFQTLFSVLLLMSIISAAGGVETTNTAPRNVHSKYRLPGDLIPYHYDLRLEPSIYSDSVHDFYFSGSVTIFLNCLSTTNVIILHQDGLTIFNASITVTKITGPGTSPAVSQVTVDSDSQFYKIHLEQPLLAGHTYALKIPSFRRQMKKDPVGLYYSSYKDGSRSVYFAATRMEPAYCRQVFPSFDEPALKATFNVTLRRYNSPRRYMILFNTPQIQSLLYDNWYTVTFERTERISTYQLAFIVSDFDYHETTHSKTPSVKIRTYAPVNRHSDSLTIHNEALKAFTELEGLFEPSYGAYMGKLDLVAIPARKVQTTGSWGLVMFDEKLLTNFKHGPAVPSLTVNPLIKALAHLWFGNMVTPKWWTWLWLSDAFASYWENYISGQLYPKWKKGPVHQMIHNRDDIAPDMSLALSNLVESPYEIKMQYDEVNKFKGHAIVRMMHLIMGDHFIPALNMFLTDHVYDSVDHQDLFDSLNKYINNTPGIDLDMAVVMEPWVTQHGYPVVNVNGQADTMALNQQQYLIRPASATSVDNMGNVFEIPITFTTSSKGNFDVTADDIVWLPATDDPNRFTTVPVPSDDPWVVVNLQYSGYYCVDYDPDFWDALINQLKADHMVIHMVNRAGIMHDAFRLAKAGLLPLVTALQTVEYMEGEGALEPWLLFLSLLQEEIKRDLVGRSEVAGQFQTFMQKTVDEFVKTYNLLPLSSAGVVPSPDSDDPKLPILTEKIRTLACEYLQDDCAALARSVSEAWRNGSPNPVRNDLRSIVYSAVVRKGGSDAWELVYNKSRTEENPEEKYRLFYALGDASDPSLLDRFLQVCMEKDEGAGNSVLLACAIRVADNRYGMDALLDFLVANVGTILEMMDYTFMLPMLDKLSKHLHTSIHLDKLQLIRDKTSNTHFLTWLDTFEGTVTNNLNWMEKNFPAIRLWLTGS